MAQSWHTFAPAQHGPEASEAPRYCPAVTGFLRSLDPKLPRSVQTLQLGGLVSAFGNGMLIPFLFIYLHNVRGIGLGVAGLVVGTNAVVSVVAGPVAGTLVDRHGGRRVLAWALAVLAAGYGGVRARP